MAEQKIKRSFIKHNFINLGVPYVVFSIVYILINCFVGQANTQSSLLDILLIWKTPTAQYWFLYALFFLFCIYTVLWGTLSNFKITVLLFLFAYLAPYFGVEFGCFDVVMYSALAFGLGTFLSIDKIEKVPSWCKVIVIVCHIIAGTVLIRLNLIEAPFIKELIMMLGIYSSILFISVLQKINFIGKFLDFVNKYSFQTYLLHTIFTAGFRIVLIKLGITNWGIHILVGTVMGLSLSVLIAVAAKKMKVPNIFFFPVKTYYQLKNK